MLEHRKVARVLFDESHSEAWTIRPETARAMQPAHPEDSSYALAAEALRARDFTVAPNLAGPLVPAALQGADVLVIAHPSDPKWEKTTCEGSPRLSAEEIEAIDVFVRDGGGLIVLGETEQDKYGNNLNDLLARFGIRVGNETVSDYERFHHAPTWVLADLRGGSMPAPDGAATDLLARVDQACFYRAATLTTGAGAHALAVTSRHAEPPGAPLLVATTHGAGRVAVLSDSDLFGDDCIADYDHEALWLNLVYWAAGNAFASEPPQNASPVDEDPHWRALKAEVDALRLLQEPDGSVAAPDGELARRTERIAAAVAGLAPRFAHQADYLAAVFEDLRGWAAGGFARPDFARSLELFRPERDRRHGAEHLVVFPMYLQNASRDVRFEALIIRVPWPAFVEQLEAERYDNPKFVPVTFVDHTAGYDSECAVLFPETVATQSPPTPPANHFGAIFCDREAARFRRVVSRAAEILRLDVPPDAAALLASAELSEGAYVLWDLIHDRAHSHGDLPFDPFMIRQRMPYWMYSLEELRCDLTAFAEATKLEAEGFAFARHVQYAILFDRLFRFPVTGTRVRNYDGLGGQLLFAYLHKHGHLHWTDNRLSVEWDRLAEGVGGLRAEVEALYREGIDRSRIAHWATAHELVSRYVPATTSSKWSGGPSDESDPKAWIDLVEDDEFPLSIFYSSLKQKLDSETIAA